MMDSECHSIILEYLMHNCFKNTAKALLKEANKLEQCTKIGRTGKLSPSHQEDESQWTFLDARKSLINAIEQGDIVLAFDLIKKHFPILAAQDLIPNGILPPNNRPEVAELQDILFQLKCQRFIEIIRTSSSTIEAIRYAQTHLKPINSRSTEQVKEVTALIAYADPHQSQSSHLLGQNRREELAKRVDQILLAQCNLPVQTSIEKITRQYSLVEQELQKSNTAASPVRNHREKVAI
ncbi:CTLH/CRA C-terminal to lish motif domain-containing protein [Parasitella parasitica]|nr:CTLH/CRA C-terminal to lish motif domain-containing protein [Parasitella parasitica]